MPGGENRVWYSQDSKVCREPTDTGAPGGSSEMYQGDSARWAAAYLQEYTSTILQQDLSQTGNGVSCQSSQTSLPPVSAPTSQAENFSPMVGNSLRAVAATVVSGDDHDIVNINPFNQSKSTNSNTQDNETDKRQLYNETVGNYRIHYRIQ